jgi:hypothetical protein
MLRLLAWVSLIVNYHHCFDVWPSRFEQMIESRSATPNPAGQPK